MPTISGSVLFNTNNPTPTTGAGVENVPIVLRDSGGLGIVVLTDTSGNYTINNVPNGTYTLVEAWGTTGGVASPADFNAAAAIAAPTPKDPPISAMPSPPATANLTQSLSPNTQNLNITGDLTNQNFVDGPVQDKPIVKLDLTTIGSNLITGADNGTYGSLDAGTSQGTSPPPPSPYAANIPGFTYVSPSTTTPGDGEYSILNMSNYNTFNTWYNTSDHTTRDETGTYFLAGASGSAIIFEETLSVSANTYYVFSGWIMNPIYLSGSYLPTQLTIKVTESGGQVLYQQSLSSIDNQNVLPIWNESSTLFNTADNTSITFQILSTGGSGTGNDYIVDDLVIQQANVDTIMSSTKSVDKANVDVGDILTYTVVLQNTGDSTISNIVFLDTIPSGTSFNSGTVQINGTTVPSANPTPPGFTLTTPVTILKSNELITITFKTTVNTIPSPNPISNTALTRYDFVPIPGGATVTQTVASNIALTNVNRAQIPTSKSRDLAYVSLGDIITYTIPITNTGSTTAINVVLKDTIPNGTTFETDSVIIDSTPQSGLSPSPPTGLSLGNILAGQTKTVSFKVKVTSTPTPNPIPNSANVSYDYVVDPLVPTTKSSSTNTNIVTSRYSLATITSTKTVNKSFADVGNTLNYTIVLFNSGNVTANNVVFIDTIPNDTSFVIGSVTINNSAQAGLNPSPPGFTLPSSIAPNRRTTITFRVTVNTIPNPNPIENSSTTRYAYTVDPSIPNGYLGGSNSTIVNTQVNHANLDTIIKTVDKDFANRSETLTYTITATNTGNVEADNIVLSDIIPSGTTFVVGSIAVTDGIGNNINFSATNPSNIVINDPVPAGDSIEVTFQVQVDSNTVPTPNPLQNTADIGYDYTVNPATPNGAHTDITSTVAQTQVNFANLSSPGNFTKTVDKDYADRSETLTYTIIANNTGNVEANNVVVSDIIPSGTTFVVGSIDVTDGSGNNVNFSATNPSNIVINDPVTAGDSIEITFQVQVDSNTVPTPNPLQNTADIGYDYTVDPATPNGAHTDATSTVAQTQVNFANLITNFTKSVDNRYVILSDTLVYTITLANTGNVTATNVNIKDVLPNGTIFVGPVSVKYDNNTNIGFTGDIQTTGITLQDEIVPIDVTGSPVVIIEFPAQIQSDTIPSDNPQVNISNISYDYTVDPSYPNNASDTGNSNPIPTFITCETQSMRICLADYSDKIQIESINVPRSRVTVSVDNTRLDNSTIVYKNYDPPYLNEAGYYLYISANIEYNIVYNQYFHKIQKKPIIKALSPIFIPIGMSASTLYTYLTPYNINYFIDGSRVGFYVTLDLTVCVSDRYI